MFEYTLISISSRVSIFNSLSFVFFSFLLSKKTFRENEEIYLYFTLKITNFEHKYNVSRTYSSASPYHAILWISCEALDNSLGGDVISNSSQFQVESTFIKEKIISFSTTVMALSNTNFDNKQKLTLNIIYDFNGTQKDKSWTGAEELKKLGVNK